MSWVLLVIAICVTTAAVAGLFAWTLAVRALSEIKKEAEQFGSVIAGETEQRALDRRVGPENRRSAARPWAEDSSGRRAEDALRQDLADAERALKDAETRLAELEARRSA